MNESTTKTGQPLLGELRELAEGLLRRGERRAAAEALESALDRDPFDDDSALLAAMIRFERGELKRACELALEALRRRPFHPAAWNLLGVASLDAGHQELALETLRHVTRIAPGLEDAKQNLRAARNTPRDAARGNRRTGKRVRIPRKRIMRLLRGRRPRVSVCLVAHDGSEAIGPCVESFLETATEVIVVDATREGLGPQTVRDARLTITRGCPEHDAAAWLNAAVRRASGDWILVAEPGDRWDPQAIPLLKRDLSRRLSLFCVVELRQASGAAWAHEVRLFRNAPGVRFSGRVFPRLHPSLEELAGRWGLMRTDARAFILAAADADGTRESDPVPDAFRRAAEEDLRQAPDDSRLLLQRAHLDLRAGRADLALESLHSCTGGVGECDIDAEFHATLEGRCLLRLERFSDLSQRMNDYHRQHPETRNTLFLQGVAARALGDPASAATLLRRCLQDPPAASFVPPLADVRLCGLPNMLGAALLELGELDEARAAFEESSNRKPGNLEARMGMLGLFLAQGQIEPMLRELDVLIREYGNDTRVWSLGGVVLGRVPQLAPVAERWMDEACAHFPEDAGLRRQLGEARLRCGHPDRALEAWGDLPLHSAAEQAARFAACLGCGGDLPQVVDSMLHDVEHEVLRWLQAWMACASYAVLDRALVDIHRTADSLPGLAGHAATWLQRIGQDEAAARIRERVSAPA